MNEIVTQKQENINKELEIQMVNFNGAELMAVKEESSNKIYVGVSYICNGIGFTKGQKDRQSENVKQDIVLNRGCRKFGAGVLDPNNEVTVIDLNFLPLWLAKISITPNMQENQPEVVDKLIEYQLKAKDVLANAFIRNVNNALQEYLNMSDEDKAIEYFQKQKEVKVLSLKNEELKPKADVFDLICDAKNYIDMSIFVKTLCIPNMGRNNMFDYLREKKILMDGYTTKNTPYQPYSKYFKVTEFERAGAIGYKTWIRPIGIPFLINLLKKDGYIIQNENELLSKCS